MINLIISGIAGRMGKRIGVLASQDKEFNIVGGLEYSKSPDLGREVGEVLGISSINKKVVSEISEAEKADVLIEFTFPEPTLKHLEYASRNNLALVIGTTALTEDHVEKVKEASKKIPIVYSANMSIGANLMFKLTEEISKNLGKEYEIEIVEAHHSKKKDAPSGTAKTLGESVKKGRGSIPPIHAIRVGDIVGDHTVIFAGNEERIELTHRAHSRDIFVKGALKAAKFIKGKKPGLYNMHDVIVHGA